jgi:GMP synthase PP-ATPase subunit
MGDGRTYENVVALRAVQTTDFMTRGLGAAAARFAVARIEPDHQRSARHQPRDLRHLVEAACDDRVGVI